MRGTARQQCQSRAEGRTEGKKVLEGFALRGANDAAGLVQGKIVRGPGMSGYHGIVAGAEAADERACLRRSSSGIRAKKARADT